MSNRMDLDHTHFKAMKKALAEIEKEWKMGAPAGVKQEVKELKRLTSEIESVIKNQLYYNLRLPAKDQLNVEENDNQTGRGDSTG